MRLEAILFQSQAFLRRFLYGLPLNRDGFPSFSATKMVAKLVDPAALQLGFTTAVRWPVWKRDKRTRFWATRAWRRTSRSERLERYYQKELKKCQAVAAFTKPYVCFVAVCSSFTKKSLQRFFIASKGFKVQE